MTDAEKTTAEREKMPAIQEEKKDIPSHHISLLPESAASIVTEHNLTVLNGQQLKFEAALLDKSGNLVSGRMEDMKV